MEEKIDYFEEKIRLSGIQDSPIVTKDSLSRFLRRGGTVPSGLSMFEASTMDESDMLEEENGTQKMIEEAEQRCDQLKLEIARLETTLQDQKGKETTLQDELAAQTSLIEENAAKVEALKKEAQDRSKKLGNGERIQQLEEEIVVVKENVRKLRDEDNRLRSLWDEKCLEDCDRTMRMFEKQQRWEEEAQEMDDQITELEKELKEREELKQQVEDMEEVMREASEKKAHAERELREYQQKNEVLEETLGDLQTKLAETQEELDSIKQSLPIEPLTNDDFEELQMNVKKQKDTRMAMEEELGILQDQVDELEDALASSRVSYAEKIQALDAELMAHQSGMEDEISRRVEDQVQEVLMRRKKEFREQHKDLLGEERPTKEDIEEQKEKLGEYLEEKIRRELQEKIREEVQEELESEIICHFEEVERENMSEIDSILDDDMDGSFEGGRCSMAAGGGGFVDRLQEILMQQCRESIFEEAEEIWAEEKLKMENELEELRTKAESAEAKERELAKKASDYTRKVQMKIREINRMKYGSSANLLGTPSGVPRHQSSGVTPSSTSQHLPIHSRTPTAPTEFSHQERPKESEKDVEERAIKAAQAAQMRVREEKKRREREKREQEKREKEEREREEAFGSPARPVTPAYSRVKKGSRLGSGTPIRRTRDQTNGTPKFVNSKKKKKKKKNHHNNQI